MFFLVSLVGVFLYCMKVKARQRKKRTSDESLHEHIYIYIHVCVSLLLFRMLSKIFVLAVKCWDCHEIIPNGSVRGMVDKLQGGEGDESLYLI